ncbi:MAG: alpha/beta fold hydrolase [Chloroflexi bacterium]|nr:alpha/beta fold hydrolase [Chloroflexota bacterium]
MPHLQVNHTEIYYETAGEGEPLLLLHGLGSTSRDWAEQIAFLSQNYHVIALDVRGHGRSAKPNGPYSIPLFADDTAALLRALGHTSAHIVGLSMGGMIGFQLAVSQPALVKSLVIINSGPEVIARTFQEKWAIFQRFLIVRLMGMRGMGQMLGKRLFPLPEQHAIQAQFVERWAENDKRAYTEAMRAIVGWSVAAQIHTIQCPVLVVAAEHDYTPLAAKEAYVANLPHAQLLVIPNSRHATSADQPEALNNAIATFLASLSPTGNA